MMAVRSVATMDVQLALILDVQFRGTSAIDLLHFEAALEDGVLGLEGLKVLSLLDPQGLVLGFEGLVLGLEGFKLGLEGLEGLQVLGLLDLEGLKASLKESLERGGGSVRVRGLCEKMW